MDSFLAFAIRSLCLTSHHLWHLGFLPKTPV